MAMTARDGVFAPSKLPEIVRMPKLSADLAQLRELAAKCRQFAATSIDHNDITLFQRTAVEYDAMADRLQRERTPS